MQTPLVVAGLKYPGARICQSPRHPLLVALALFHAEYMAGARRQSHHRFQSRYDRIRAELGLRSAEICAESWDRQAHAPMEEIGREMFRCWEQSEGHWRVASSVHAAFGDGLARSKRGIWYACMIAGDLLEVSRKS